MAFVFVLSRKRRYHCDRCGAFYYSHTPTTRLWLALWILYWSLIAFVILGLVLGTVRR
jgi:hypothetical protein